jgi:hypothetical protein
MSNAKYDPFDGSNGRSAFPRKAKTECARSPGLIVSRIVTGRRLPNGFAWLL